MAGIWLYRQTLTLLYVNGHIIQTENRSVIYLKTFFNFLFFIVDALFLFFTSILFSLYVITVTASFSVVDFQFHATVVRKDVLNDFYLKLVVVIANTLFQHTRNDSTHGHHQMVNTEIRLIIFIATKDGKALYSQQK